MSFGLKPFNHGNQRLKQAYHDIAKAIENSKNKILFAAAANAGNNTGRAFPASCEEVICVHASDGKGKDGLISPSAYGKEDNFMTLGIAVECDNLDNPKEPKKEYKSGTSYATPIAAAMAAQVLYVTECLMDVRTPSQECLRTRKGMRKLFEIMCDPTDSSGYRFLAPWVKLWPGDWHENEDTITLVESKIHNTEGLQYSISEEKTDTEGLDAS
jgi:subtilisin family serine protease